MNKLEKKEVEKVAKLASLELSEAELKKFTEELSEVIDYNANELTKVNVEGVEPLTNVTGLTDVFREDETEPSLTQDEATANTKSKHNGFFKVKAILE